MKADNKTEAEVMAVLNRMSDAYARRDMNGLLALCVSEPDLVMYGTGADEKRIGLAGVQAQAERDWSQTESASLQFGWRSVSAAGSVAWVATDTSFNIKAGGQEMSLPARITAVLERRGDQWLIAQMHFSFPSAGQSEGESFPT